MELTGGEVARIERPNFLVWGERDLAVVALDADLRVGDRLRVVDAHDLGRGS